MNIIYPAKLTHNKKESRYLIQFYDLEEAVTEGETLEEALFNASEALTLSLEGRLDENLDVPTPSHERKRGIMVAPSARVQAALLVRMNRGKHSIAEIARTLNSSWPAISRMENPHHWPSLRQLERIASALGQRLVLSLEPIESNSQH